MANFHFAIDEVILKIEDYQQPCYYLQTSDYSLVHIYTTYPLDFKYLYLPTFATPKLIYCLLVTPCEYPHNPVWCLVKL